jgi:hypothetical protein
MRFFCVCVVLYLGSDLATGWSLFYGVLPSVKNDYGTELKARALNGLEDPLKKCISESIFKQNYKLIILRRNLQKRKVKVN